MMRVLFAGGGTGGHVYPALAIAEALGPAETLFVGSRRGIEERIVRSAGMEYHGLEVEGFHRRPTLKNLLFPLRTLGAFIASVRLVGAFRPQVVVGTGGFASGPPVLAAQLRGITTVLQEQNAHPGATTRLLARSATEIHVAFREAIEKLPETARQRVQISGNPVRGSLASGTRSTAEARAAFGGLDPDRPTLVVLGGSQGSRRLNRSVAALLTSSRDRAYQVLWSAGRALYDEVRADLGENVDAPGVVVLPYVDDMAAAYGAADLVLCRAGAITCAELALVGRPALFVPLASAAGNHQHHNASAFAAAGAAEIIPESALLDPRAGGDTLGESLDRLFADSTGLATMARASASLGRPDAARVIAGRVRTLIEGGRS